VTDPIDDQNKDNEIKKHLNSAAGNTAGENLPYMAEGVVVQEEDEKEGKGGKGRAGGGGGIKLPPNKLKDVVSVWKHLDLAEAVARVAEFFSEVPARASANLSVTWSTAKRHGFALVNHFISSGQEIAHLMRSRDAGFIKRLRTKYGVSAKRVGVTQQVMSPGMDPTVG
jgi:hypothetical protein